VTHAVCTKSPDWFAVTELIATALTLMHMGKTSIDAVLSEMTKCLCETAVKRMTLSLTGRSGAAQQVHSDTQRVSGCRDNEKDMPRG
jgi:hypothetical protein